MNLYLVEHPGVCIPGYSLICAETKAEAEASIVSFLKRSGLNYSVSQIKIRLVPKRMKRGEIIEIWDGDF